MDPDTVGPYRIVRRLGSGGMGVVYLAEDGRLGRKVAVKVLPPDADPAALGRFVREARTAAVLQHPHIAVIHDVGQDEGISYLVMERIEGETLRVELGPGPLPWPRVLEIGEQLASALAHAHGLGVLHRDIKPANVVLSPTRGAVLLDFGLAEWLDRRDPGTDPSETPTETVAVSDAYTLGTAIYMTPEQLRREPSDARSDLFQLGLVLYEAAAGRHPFSGPTTIDVQHAILNADPPALRDVAEVPDELSRIVAKLLEKSPRYRYPDARALEVDLRGMRRDLSSDAVRLPPAGPTPERRAGRRAAVALATGSVALLAALALWAWWGSAPERALPPSRLVPLTHGEGNDGGPSFSPDGRSLVFTSDRGGDWDLWVTLVSGGTPVRITDTPEAESQPAWSPDGLRTAFTRHRRDAPEQDVFVMPALGGEARRLVENASDPSWSPDGRWIAYADQSAGWIRLAKIAVDSRSAPVGVTEPEEGFFHRRPRFSPDGTTIVYNRSPGGLTGQLMGVRSDGGTPWQITDDPAGTINIAPAFTPDGRHVVHVSDRGGPVNLWRVPLRGGQPLQITSGSGSDLSPSVSPDGSRIAFSLDPVASEILTFRPGEPRGRTIRDAGETLTWAPDLSPDGTRVLFSRKVAGRPWKMAVVPRDGGEIRTVAEDLPHVFWARFLPDGRSLVFHAVGPEGARLGRVGLDGSGLTWLTGTERRSAYPDASPDGEWIAFVREDAGEASVVLRPLAGGEERLVARGATLPTFSPDGTRLAIARTRSYAGGVGVVELDAGEPRWLTSRGTWPTWMPDGRSIAYGESDAQGRQRAMVVPTDGGPPRALEPFRWTGRHYPFVIDPGSGELITTNGAGRNTTIWIAEY